MSRLDWEKGLYILFILLAIITRFYDLGHRVVSHDESLHTHYSYAYYAGNGYEHTPMMHGPSLFHATALSYWLFGADDFSARIPVALLGIFLVFMPYLLRDWIGRPGRWSPVSCCSFRPTSPITPATSGTIFTLSSSRPLSSSQFCIICAKRRTNTSGGWPLAWG
jgi:4-amino-4-deoxy-L-arabinose transferase-like glycosyltransferase